MLTAIPRYGARVLPNTQQIIAEVAGRGELLEGPQIAEFERAFARRIGAGHAVATSYGRVAFYYLLKALDVPAGGEIVFPALTFWVMPEMARVAGFTPVFAVSRCAGWLAHAMEQQRTGRMIRPTSRYVGPDMMG